MKHEFQKACLFDSDRWRQHYAAGINLKEVRSSLGPSNELTNSVVQNDKLNKTVKDKEVSSVMVQEAHFLASCTYEKGTMWGQKVSDLIYYFKVGLT